MKVTPMMGQWHACKQVAGDALLFFRMGDFYELFHDDAVEASKLLGLTLTKRQEVPMAGVPHHQLENYLDKLLAHGKRVAIGEQTEDPRQAKGLVKREVTRIVTPGTTLTSNQLPDKANNFFVSLAQVGSLYGVAILDLSTTEFRVAEFEDVGELAAEIFRLQPSELLVQSHFHSEQDSLMEDLRLAFEPLTTVREDWFFDHQMAVDFLRRHFGVHSLDGFGLGGMTAPINAAGALLQYLSKELRIDIAPIRSVTPFSTDEALALDPMTQRNLELTRSMRDGSTKHTLLSVLDQTETAMGGRLLRQWILRPLLDVEAISARQERIGALLAAPSQCREMGEALSQVKDLERLSMRIASGCAGPRDLVALRFSLDQLPTLKRLTGEVLPGMEALDPLTDVAQAIAAALVDEPPLRLSDGNAFREGYNAQLDELRQLARDGKSWMASYQARVRDETGIKNMKVGFNRVFGYYLEVSKGQTHLVPDSFQRRQTLTNYERYISPELKEYESKVLTAEEQMGTLESELFATLLTAVADQVVRILKVAHLLAGLDCLVSLARVARREGYCRPLVDDSRALQIQDGRHPIIEASLIAERFIPNDTEINGSQLLVITGPNMAGKSTYIRQVALITVMAQMGSYVPARSAHIGLVDKVFTRIGASDDLSRGQSTFMVEMSETANILNNCSDRSLVILDEIGRGTSTYDGIAIAWSVAEALMGKPRTLFATHYFELTQLEGAHNYNVLVQEADGHIVFLHKIAPGAADQSYGIHCAKLAGIPLPVIDRAQQILRQLETKRAQQADVQLALF
jgi:DNA mismatch repair protein MutS